MATFRVGQRVRVIGNSTSDSNGLLGCTGTILHGSLVGLIDHWYLEIDGRGRFHPGGVSHYAAFSCDLSPLTDPGAERFVESLKKLAREPMPQKETA